MTKQEGQALGRGGSTKVLMDLQAEGTQGGSKWLMEHLKEPP